MYSHKNKVIYPEFGNIINDKLSIILGATSEVEKYLKTH